MSDLPITAVIPVSRAHLPYFRRALSSAAEADMVIVVFDGDFGTMNYHLDSHVAFYWHEYPHGVCAARNTAIANAPNGELILPLDSDDELIPGAIKALREAWQPGTVVYGDWKAAWPSPSESTLRHAAILNNHNEPTFDTLEIAPPPERVWAKSVCHASYLYSKDDWQKVGGYNPDYNVGAEDWSFMLSLLVNDCKLVKIDAPIYRRHQVGSGRTGKAQANAGIIKLLLQRDFGERYRG